MFFLFYFISFHFGSNKIRNNNNNNSKKKKKEKKRKRKKMFVQHAANEVAKQRVSDLRFQVFAGFRFFLNFARFRRLSYLVGYMSELGDGARTRMCAANALIHEDADTDSLVDAFAKIQKPVKRMLIRPCKHASRVVKRTTTQMQYF